MSDGVTIALSVLAAKTIGDVIGELTVTNPDGDPLPDWEPGAHVEVRLPSGRRRRYSICSGLRERREFRFLFIRSGAAHSAFDEVSTLTPGTRLQAVLHPSAFPAPRSSDRVLIVCGGIGVTPMLSIAEAAESAGAEVEALHFVSGERGCLLSTMLGRVIPPDRLRVHFGGRSSGAVAMLEQTLRNAPSGTSVYCCGPKSLMQTVIDLAGRRTPVLDVHRESFDDHPPDPDVNDRHFQVRLEGHSDWIGVPPGRSLLSVLEEHGFRVPSSCRRGICGTCMVWVKEGVPEHRDTFLMGAAREANRCMLTCVSRAKSDRLVIEI